MGDREALSDQVLDRVGAATIRERTAALWLDQEVASDGVWLPPMPG